MGGPNVPSAEEYSGVGETHEGILAGKGNVFGCIRCEVTKPIYGVDVVCSVTDLADMNVGDAVQFDLLVKSGKPFARNVRVSVASAEEYSGVGETHEGILVGKGKTFGCI